MKSDKADSEFDYMKYMHDFVIEFEKKYSKVRKTPEIYILKEIIDSEFAVEYRKYNNYLLALIFPEEIVRIASSEGYDTDHFPLEYLDNTNWRYLNTIIEEMWKEKAKVKKISQRNKLKNRKH